MSNGALLLLRVDCGNLIVLHTYNTVTAVPLDVTTLMHLLAQRFILLLLYFNTRQRGQSASQRKQGRKEGGVLFFVLLLFRLGLVCWCVCCGRGGLWRSCLLCRKRVKEGAQEDQQGAQRLIEGEGVVEVEHGEGQRQELADRKHKVHSHRRRDARQRVHTTHADHPVIFTQRKRERMKKKIK